MFMPQSPPINGKCDLQYSCQVYVHSREKGVNNEVYSGTSNTTKAWFMEIGHWSIELDNNTTKKTRKEG